MNVSVRKTMSFISFFLLGILLNSPIAQTPTRGEVHLTSYKAGQPTEIPKSLERKFRRDAARLALRINAEREDLRYQNILIPRNMMDEFFKILSNIYLKDETAKSIAKCNVHTFPNPSIDNFIVIFDKNIGWAEPLRQGISETTSEAINDLLDDFDLIIDKHVNWNDTQDAITIRSKEPLNMAALANEFYNIDGVTEIDLRIPEAGGNDIVVQRVSGGWDISYILRFGSYINNNGKSHIWKYRTMDDGSVQLLSEEGDEIPSWMRCHFQETEFLVKRL